MSKLKPVAALAIALLSSACSKTEVARTPPLISTPLEMSAGSMSTTAASDAGIESCAKAALARMPGTLLRATLRSTTEGRIWEFTIRRAAGKPQELLCADAAGTLAEPEAQSTSEADPGFKAAAKIDVATAEARALEAKPGTVEHMERRLGAEGLARYRIAISNDEGRYRVDIDASSGELVEVSRELLQIGGV